MAPLLKFLSLFAFIMTAIRSDIKWMIFTLLVLFLAIIADIGDKKEDKNPIPKNPPEKKPGIICEEISNGNHSIFD